MKTIPVIIDDKVVQPKNLNIMFADVNHDIQTFRSSRNPENADSGRFGFILINTEQADTDGNFDSQSAGRYAAIPVMFLQTLPDSMVSLHPATSGSISRSGNVVTSSQRTSASGREDDYSDEINLELSRREKQILNYVAQGCLNKQIADTLSISEQTIKNHVTSILRKLNASGRTQAVINAIKLGLIEVPQTVR